MDEDEKPKETTPQGYEVPIPERRDFFGNLKRAAKPDKPDEASSEPPPAPAAS